MQNSDAEPGALLSLREHLASGSAAVGEEQVKRWLREVVVEYRQS